MLDHISSLEQLETEAKDMQSYLDTTPSEDGNEAAARGNDLNAMISRSGKMLADAKYHLNQAKRSETIALLQEVAKKTPFATSKTVNALVDSVCKKEQFLVDWIERINRTATHQLEWCRSLVSKAKAEYIASKY